MIERSSGTRTPSLRALSAPRWPSRRRPRRSPSVRAREQGGAVPGGRLGRPVRPEDPAVVAREVLLLDRREEGLEPVGSGCARRSGARRRCSRSSCGRGRRGARPPCAWPPGRRSGRTGDREPGSRWPPGRPSRSTSSISSLVMGMFRVMTPSTRFHSMFCEAGGGGRSCRPRGRRGCTWCPGTQALLDGADQGCEEPAGEEGATTAATRVRPDASEVAVGDAT